MAPRRWLWLTYARRFESNKLFRNVWHVSRLCGVTAQKDGEVWHKIKRNYSFLQTVSLYVLYLSQNKERLFPYRAVSGGFCNRDGECLLSGTNWMSK